MWNEEDDDVDDISNDGGQESEVDIGKENIQHSEDATTLDTGESQETSKQKIVVAPPIRRQQVRSNKQALKEVANSLKVMAETSPKALQNYGRGRQKKRREIHGISKRTKKIGNMNCALLKYLREQHNQHPHHILVSVTFRSVTCLHPGAHIFQTKQQDQQILTIMIFISFTFN